MDADLDLLLTAVYVTADDLLPEKAQNAKRSVTDAEVVTLCVAQAIMGIPSDRRFLAVAHKHLRHLFPKIPAQPGYFKRRRRLADTLEWLMSVFASQSPGFYDDLLLVDSTPVECARSRETVKRSALGDAADYGYCRSHSRFFWGFRLHGDLRPRRNAQSRDGRLAQTRRARCRTGALGAHSPPGRRDADRRQGLRRAGIRAGRQRNGRDDPQTPAARTSPAEGHTSRRSASASSRIFWSCKGTLTLERHGARTLPGLRERILQRLLTLAAAISLNHQLGRPSRALVDYCA